MTVKCLNDEQKDVIAFNYESGEFNQQELAHLFEVSRRTIYRVLMERGLLKPRRSAERALVIPEAIAMSVSLKTIDSFINKLFSCVATVRDDKRAAA